MTGYGACSCHGRYGITVPADSLDGICRDCRASEPLARARRHQKDAPPGAVSYVPEGTLNRHVLNERHAEVLRRWLPGYRPPVGLLDGLAKVVEDYSQVAAREAASGRQLTLEEAAAS